MRRTQLFGADGCAAPRGSRFAAVQYRVQWVPLADPSIAAPGRSCLHIQRTLPPQGTLLRACSPSLLTAYLHALPCCSGVRQTVALDGHFCQVQRGHGLCEGCVAGVKAPKRCFQTLVGCMRCRLRRVWALSPGAFASRRYSAVATHGSSPCATPSQCSSPSSAAC